MSLLDTTEFLNILDKFTFKVITILSQISELMYLDLKMHVSCLIKSCVQKWFFLCFFNSNKKYITVYILRDQCLRKVLF